MFERNFLAAKQENNNPGRCLYVEFLFLRVLPAVCLELLVSCSASPIVAVAITLGVAWGSARPHAVFLAANRFQSFTLPSNSLLLPELQSSSFSQFL